MLRPRSGGGRDGSEGVSPGDRPSIRQIRYKGYLLRACSFERRPGVWIAQAQALWDEGPLTRTRELREPDADRNFTSRELADERALGLAQAWVDTRQTKR